MQILLFIRFHFSTKSLHPLNRIPGRKRSQRRIPLEVKKERKREDAKLYRSCVYSFLSSCKSSQLSLFNSFFFDVQHFFLKEASLFYCCTLTQDMQFTSHHHQTMKWTWIIAIIILPFIRFSLGITQSLSSMNSIVYLHLAGRKKCT